MVFSEIAQTFDGFDPRIDHTPGALGPVSLNLPVGSSVVERRSLWGVDDRVAGPAEKLLEWPSPLLQVSRVTTRSRLGTKAISWPPEPGLERASIGIPRPLRPSSPVKLRRQLPSVRKRLGIEVETRLESPDVVSGGSGLVDDHMGTTRRPFQRPPCAMR